MEYSVLKSVVCDNGKVVVHAELWVVNVKVTVGILYVSVDIHLQKFVVDLDLVAYYLVLQYLNYNL